MTDHYFIGKIFIFQYFENHYNFTGPLPKTHQIELSRGEEQEGCNQPSHSMDFSLKFYLGFFEYQPGLYPIS